MCAAAARLLALFCCDRTDTLRPPAVGYPLLFASTPKARTSATDSTGVSCCVHSKLLLLLLLLLLLPWSADSAVGPETTISS
jgi:hypothetical protein